MKSHGSNAPVTGITREVTAFLVACASEADPRERIRKARRAIESVTGNAARAGRRGQTALRALMAHALAEAGRADEARREWLRMAAAGLAPVRARIEAGLIAEAQGNHGAAERDYREATRRAKDADERAEAYAVLARYFVRRRQAERALTLLRDAVRRRVHPLLRISTAYVEARITGDPAPLAKFRATLERQQRTVPLYGYFLGFLELWDGRTLEAVRALRGFVSRGIDHAAGWGRELAPELEHARRTILQIDAMARVLMP